MGVDMKSFNVKGKGLSPLFLIIIASVSFAVYSNSLHVPFALDDSHTIQENMQIRELANFSSPKKFLGPRAVANFTFALNYRLGELDVFGYHVVNILIHSANGFMVYFLSLALLGRLTVVPGGTRLQKFPQARVPAGQGPAFPPGSTEIGEGKAGAGDPVSLPMHLIALFAALIFVAHPLQTQAVTYIAQRYTSLAAFFYLGAVLFYIKGRTLSRDSNSSPLTPYSLLSTPEAKIPR